MSTRIDITGQRFGRLLVLEFTGTNEDRRTLWKCKCDCGNEVITSGRSMRLKYTSSCGCLKTDTTRITNKRKRKYGTATDNYEFYRHKEGARNRGLTSLPREEWEKIIVQPCYYCGEIDTRSFLNSNKNIHKIYLLDEITKYDKKMNGIDRIDSSKDYTDVGNSVPCCKMCNWIKNDYSKEEFLNHIDKIYYHTHGITP